MQGTQTFLTEAVAVETARSPQAVIDIIQAARKLGVVAPTKRGLGAKPLSLWDTTAVMVAVTFDGPADLAAASVDGTTPNLAMVLAMLPSADGPAFAALRQALGIADPRAPLRAYAAALVALVSAGRIFDLVADRPDEDAYGFDGADVQLSIERPFPVARLSFVPAPGLAQAFGRSPGDVDPVTFTFAHAAFHERRDEVIDTIHRNASRGMRTARTIDGRLLEACARSVVSDRAAHNRKS